MTREQAAELITAINAIAPYCPPILFERVSNSTGLRIVLSVANGQTELTAKLRDLSENKGVSGPD